MSKPRICIVAPEFIGPFPNGGVGTACYWEAATLGNAGYDVTVLYTGPTEVETPEHWEEHFARTAPFRYEDLSRQIPVDDFVRVSRYEQCCVEERTSEHVLAWLQPRQFDLILFQEFLGHGTRALQARRSGVALDGTRAAVTMHSCRQWIYEGMKRLPGGPWDLAVDFLEKEAARQADRVIAPSRHMAQWAASRWRLSAAATVIPYCYDPALAKPTAAVSHAGPFRHLVFFGRLETRKGLHLFCRALVNDPALRQGLDRVTFLGKSSSVEGRSSEEFIAEHMKKIPGLEWEVIGNLGSFEAQAWLMDQQNMLVVAPSLVDNLPYAVIELHSRRIPFVSTNIGGIPEIVGEANQHQLALPTEESLAATIGRVCRDGRLDVDYRSGFEVASANAAHVDFVKAMLAASAPRQMPAAAPRFQVVVTNAADSAALAEVRARIAASDPATRNALWVRFDDWKQAPKSIPALFIDARVKPDAACASRLMTAIEQPGVDVATSYFLREDDRDTVRVVTPFGACLETGWRQNTFGGPCFTAQPRAFAALQSATVHEAFALWPAYAAVACQGLSLAMVPMPLYSVTADALRVGGHAELEAVLHQFHARMPSELDLGWTLKSVMNSAAATAIPAAAPVVAPGGRQELTRQPRTVAQPLYDRVGRVLYDRLIGISDELLAAYAGFDQEAATDSFIQDFANLRARLEPIILRWRATEPRVYIYGIGQHTRMLLTVCPELGRFVAGFIDRQAAGRFLGRSCITPEKFRSDMADALVYSSREYESEMYARMEDVRVEHVLLYRDSPAPPEPTTTARLRNRFGHAPTNQHGMWEIMNNPPAWVTGFVSGFDAMFLFEMIAGMRPQTVAELGVAAGVSSAALLYALDQLPEPEQRVLYSVDVRPTCYFNDAYETGQACAEIYPGARAQWKTGFTMDARALAEQLPEASVDFTFIDANHAHPWPLLDLLQATAFAKPGSWVALHDVDLPVQHPEFPIYGPRWLYQMWPFNKVKSFDKWASIAAVQLPDHPSQLVPLALSLLERPWEHAPELKDIVLPPAFAAVQAALEARLGVRPEARSEAPVLVATA